MNGKNGGAQSDQRIKIGWGREDITPDGTVFIAGQFHARVSEGVRDPLTATACVLENEGSHVVFVSCDLVTQSDELRAAVEDALNGTGCPVDRSALILNATHTHDGPEVRLPSKFGGQTSAKGTGIEDQVDAWTTRQAIDFIAPRIARAICAAWDNRAAGGISFGLGHAVVARNRRWVNADGRATMYGLGAAVADTFRHIEGYEDHSINLIGTYDVDNLLTGLIVNIACPSQETGSLFEISADFWHETREELRRRIGRDIEILPQLSAAGDQSPSLLFENAARDRMLELSGRSMRGEIAHRLANGVMDILPVIEKAIITDPVLRHASKELDLPMNRITAADAEAVAREADEHRLLYEKEKRRLESDPDARKEPRWYLELTRNYRRMNWLLNAVNRFEKQDEMAVMPTRIHAIRLGDIAFMTNEFEYYLDFGIQLKVRSPAVQTFLVQLCGPGTYIPSPRSVSGGGYGSVPASNPVGPEGGQILADESIQLLRGIWG